MKLTRQLLSIGFALLVSTVLASAIPGRAEVKKVVGQATVAKAAGGSTSITAGMVLGTGDTITTGKGSTVDLDLGINGDQVRVDPDSTLKLDMLEIGNVSQKTVTTSMSIGKGSVTGNVINKLTAASKYEIKTASGVAGIRGTIYHIRTDGTLVVLTGRVNFVLTTGQIVSVAAGQEFKAGVNTAAVPVTAANRSVVEAAYVSLTGAGVPEPIIAQALGLRDSGSENPLTVSAQ